MKKYYRIFQIVNGTREDLNGMPALCDNIPSKSNFFDTEGSAEEYIKFNLPHTFIRDYVVLPVWSKPE